MNTSCLYAGAAAADVTPTTSQFLYGYPHVERMSTGVNDPLLASALYLECGQSRCLFIAVDVILMSKPQVATARKRIGEATGLPPAAIMVTATHTHSGPVAVPYLSNEYDETVPRPDPACVQLMEDGIVRAGIDAWKARRPAELAFVTADATGIGTCRHDPKGPRDLNVPVVAVREAGGGKFISVMLVCAMHPTVLHEDSTLISGDFPAYGRMYLQKQLVGADCPVVYHTGASGNQSPRHVTKSNTFAEAERLGTILGKAVEKSLKNAAYETNISITTDQTFVDLPPRQAPQVSVAEERAQMARAKLNAMQGIASRAEIRTAECDWFGAEESVAIARAAEQGRLEQTLASFLPAEVQIIGVGDHLFIGWPGEFFIEFAQRIKAKHPNSTVITLANGELQGYVVTQAAIDNLWYEAGNALLQSPDSGDRMIEATEALLAKVHRPVHA